MRFVKVNLLDPRAPLSNKTLSSTIIAATNTEVIAISVVRRCYGGWFQQPNSSLLTKLKRRRRLQLQQVASLLYTPKFKVVASYNIPLYCTQSVQMWIYQKLSTLHSQIYVVMASDMPARDGRGRRWLSDKTPAPVRSGYMSKTKAQILRKIDHPQTLLYMYSYTCMW